MNKDWSAEATKTAYKQLTERFEILGCDYQVITDKRIVECWRGQRIDGDEPETVFVVLINNGVGKVSVLFYGANFWHGFQSK